MTTARPRIIRECRRVAERHRADGRPDLAAIYAELADELEVER
jgi:hypothetical protein